MALPRSPAAALPGPQWAEQDSWSYRDLDQAPLSAECRDELETLRAEAGGGRPPGGWPAGWPAPPLVVRESLFLCLFRAALARGSCGTGGSCGRTWTASWASITRRVARLCSTASS
ncbi:hypothetical protein SAV31267_088560 [Streptomyces avermitilis]|uniref:Uncharacterized protein n=1 Tax=Streptomyces avermitilis TaxID=33903 RepID=A0A4D4N498_STRAX|nr:hypothetical protein SAVMC3_11440 [Streptomyces avermitilis]GDY79371.1 hypothetical protein SAV31267_088560 [Streptomyces avermitilis]